MQLEQIPTHLEYIAFDLHASKAHFQSVEQFKSYLLRFWQFKLLKQIDLFQSGDLCRSSDQSPDAVGQEDN